MFTITGILDIFVNICFCKYLSFLYLIFVSLCMVLKLVLNVFIYQILPEINVSDMKVPLLASNGLQQFSFTLFDIQVSLIALDMQCIEV